MATKKNKPSLNAKEETSKIIGKITEVSSLPPEQLSSEAAKAKLVKDKLNIANSYLELQTSVDNLVSKRIVENDAQNVAMKLKESLLTEMPPYLSKKIEDLISTEKDSGKLGVKIEDLITKSLTKALLALENSYFTKGEVES